MVISHTQAKPPSAPNTERLLTHLTGMSRRGLAVNATRAPQEARFGICRFDGCGRVSIVAKHQLCQTHHKQFMAGRELRPIRTTNTERLGTCTFEGCRYIVRSKDLGLCSAHIAQTLAGVTLTPVKQRVPCEARDIDGNKWCFGCDTWKPESAYSQSSGKKDGLQPRCKACAKAVYGATNAEVRAANRKGKYGLSADAFNALLASQGGQCAICRADNPGAKFWAVDHDHSCCPGQTSCGRCVRGVLCGACNLGLGAFRDDMGALLRAADYLHKWICVPTG